MRFWHWGKGTNRWSFHSTDGVVELLCDKSRWSSRSKKNSRWDIKQVQNQAFAWVYSLRLIALNSDDVPERSGQLSKDWIHPCILTFHLSGKTPNQLLHELMEYGEIMQFPRSNSEVWRRFLFIPSNKHQQNGIKSAFIQREYLARRQEKIVLIASLCWHPVLLFPANYGVVLSWIALGRKR